MPAPTPYAFRFGAGPALVVRGQTTTVEVTVERDGAAPTITSATYALANEGGTSVGSGLAATVTGGNVSAAVPASWTTSEDLGPNWVETWSVVINAVTYTVKRDVALCAALLHCPVADADVIAERRDLGRAEFLPDDVASWQSYIDAAWKDVIDRMIEDGLRYWRIRSPSRLRRAVLARAMGKIMRDLSTRMEAGDKYDADADRWEAEYDKALGRLTLLLDQDEDGAIDAEQAEQPAVILTGRRVAGWPVA